MTRRSLFLFIAAGVLCAHAQEPIRYTVRFPAPQTHYLEVSASIPASGSSLEVFMAVWTPGSYGRHGGKGRQGPAVAKLHPVLRYGAAFGITFLAAAMVGAVDLALSFPPFLLFAMAAGLSWLFFGFGPCVLSITLSVLASDFFFIQPHYELSMNGAPVRLASVYAAGAALSRMAAYWTAKHGGNRISSHSSR